MANKLPNNYIEILTYLRDCLPDGMTTAQIFNNAKKNRYFEFKNSTKVSSVIFYMREKNLVKSFDTFGDRIHKITEHGMAQLDDEIGQASTQPIISMPTEPIDEIIQDIQNGANEIKPPEPLEPLTPETEPRNVHSLIYEFDEHFKIVRTALIEELAEIKTHCIKNKHLKLAVLEKLEPMYNSEISGVIAAIRSDLEQMGDL